MDGAATSNTGAVGNEHDNGLDEMHSPGTAQNVPDKLSSDVSSEEGNDNTADVTTVIPPASPERTSGNEIQQKSHDSTRSISVSETDSGSGNTSLGLSSVGLSGTSSQGSSSLLQFSENVPNGTTAAQTSSPGHWALLQAQLLSGQVAASNGGLALSQQRIQQGSHAASNLNNSYSALLGSYGMQGIATS